MGGNVLSQGVFVPGGGGMSYTGSSIKTSFKSIRFIEDVLNMQYGDGYVDIVHADCECVFKCKIYDEEDAFECTCPASTFLAPNDRDCYSGKYCNRL